MDFQTFHDYARLARRGLVLPLSCPRCGMTYVTRIGADDEPVLQCFGCNSLTKPGQAMYDEITEAVRSHSG